MLAGPITIHDATVNDIPFLQAMIWEALLASPTFLAQHQIMEMQLAEAMYWSRWLERPDPAFVARDASGQDLGAVTAKPDVTRTEEKMRSGWRIGIGVVAHARGQRVGQALLERVLKLAADTQANYVTLLVDPVNVSAIKLYKRVGFVDVGEQENLLEMRIEMI